MLVATAGHVDHGKTSLVQRLTGTNTDRLEEEKRRGLTIELGYAFRETGAGETIGFIDVPGHQRFINTMISGVSSIDVGMLVIAADDGPMPQTREHLHIMRLLGVEKYIVVISKIDLVDEARTKEVISEVQSLLPGAAIYKISNQSGEGIEALVGILEAQVSECQRRQGDQQFRMYIDRVFTKKGAGLVVTGTSLSGRVALEDELFLHWAAGDKMRKESVRVRGLHVQGKEAEAAHAGQRCAINLSTRLARKSVNRGDFLCSNAEASPSRRLDTRFHPLDDSMAALKHMGRVKLYIGTRRVGAISYLLGRKQRDDVAGSDVSQKVQFMLEEDVLAFNGDRFIIRTDNEKQILGGGIVLDPEAPKDSKSSPGRLRLLDALESGDPKQALEQMLFTDENIINLSRWKRIWNLSSGDVGKMLDDPPFHNNCKKIYADDGAYVVPCAQWEQFKSDFDEALSNWHVANPEESGIKAGILEKQLTGEIPVYLFKAVLNDRLQSGFAIQRDNLVSRADHKPALSPRALKDWQALTAYMTGLGFHLPLRSEIQKDMEYDAGRVENITRPAIKSGDLFEIGEKRVALPETLREISGSLAQLAQQRDAFTVIEVKQQTGLGRNQTIEILEFFDSIGYTKRIENARIIANATVIDNKLGGGRDK